MHRRAGRGLAHHADMIELYGGDHFRPFARSLVTSGVCSAGAVWALCIERANKRFLAQNHELLKAIAGKEEAGERHGI